MSSATNQPSSPFCFLDFLSGVRIDLQANPGEVRSVQVEPNHENGSGDDQKQKPFHLAV
jgi:hypothetical protein